MSPATFVGRRGIRPLATRWGWLAGHRLVFDLPIGPGERACANVVPDDGARLAGVLYRITTEQAAHLDRTEGVPNGVYRRIPIEVLADGGEWIAAFTYRSARGETGRKPSARYLGLLLDGARAGGLPADYVTWLQGFDLAFDERTVQDGPGVPAQRAGSVLMDRTVRFYFAYDSPYAFLANSRLERELRPLRVRIDRRPVWSPRSGGGPDPDSPRIRYIGEDVRRFAAAYGIAMRPGPIADTRRACLGFLWAAAQGRGTAYHDGVYAARFAEGGDVAERDTLAAVAVRAGLDRERFLAALDDPEWERALAASNEAARGDGVFGFPFFVFRDQSFWGNDRIEWLADAVRAAGERAQRVPRVSSS
jgi:2-hydroxychromene-2-carboxylate isomerase